MDSQTTKLVEMMHCITNENWAEINQSTQLLKYDYTLAAIVDALLNN